MIEHVITISNRLTAMPEIVQEKIKAWYDKRSRFREFEHGVKCFYCPKHQRTMMMLYQEYNKN